MAAPGVEALLPGDLLQPLRYAGDSLVGYLPHEGRDSLVFDLHWRLGVSRTRPLEKCQLAVCGSGGKLRVYVVAEARGPLRVRPEAFEPLAPDGIPAQLGYLRGLLEVNGNQVPWLDLELLGPRLGSSKAA